MIKLQISAKWNQNTESLIIPIAVSKNIFKNIEPLSNFSAKNLQNTFKAQKGEIQILPTEKQTIFLLGLGDTPFEAKSIIKIFRSLTHRQKGKLSNKIGLYLNHLKAPEQVIEYALNGLILGSYKIGHYKTTRQEAHPFEAKSASLKIYAKSNSRTLRKLAQKGISTAETQMSIFGLVNAPSNKKVPAVLGQWAIDSGKKYGYKVEVWEKAKIEKKGLHALLAVNRGSECPPRFIIMEYKGKGAKQKVGLVGKGVTFDTGGISMKRPTNMHMMKSDMGGAAAVLGTMELAAKLQLPIHLIGIVPSTDNSVDALAIKPGDVIDSYSGQTIEVIDTDAEGRLILSDGIAYMLRHFKPDTLIDLATLTGSAVRTFGYHAGALFSNNDKLAAALSKAGDTTGERVWRLPVWDVYKDEMKSDIADIKNFSGRPMAGAITAAIFLQNFIEDHPNWAHLDIAGVAFNDADFSMQKSATAFGIRLLVNYLENLVKK
ncbi:MAG: leucyl aminopeptidase family protein [Bacteroidota bacterium]